MILRSIACLAMAAFVGSSAAQTAAPPVGGGAMFSGSTSFGAAPEPRCPDWQVSLESHEGSVQHVATVTPTTQAPGRPVTTSSSTRESYMLKIDGEICSFTVTVNRRLF